MDSLEPSAQAKGVNQDSIDVECCKTELCMKVAHDDGEGRQPGGTVGHHIAGAEATSDQTDYEGNAVNVSPGKGSPEHKTLQSRLERAMRLCTGALQAKKLADESLLREKRAKQVAELQLMDCKRELHRLQGELNLVRSMLRSAEGCAACALCHDPML
jgi:hypothetical protein